MLKFKQNHTFHYSVKCWSRLGKRPSPMATEYHEHNTKQRFGSNNPELLRERKLNEYICFELFVGDLYEKLPRWATKENETKSKAEQCEESINY